ncbi:phosphoribosyltransferase family protein [Nonomuraea sp. NPDC004186]
MAEEYFDKYQFEADPTLLDELASGMVSLVPEGTEVLAGLEMGGIAVVTALGRRTGLPCAFVRKTAKSYGTARLAEGADVKGRRVLVVEDVVTSGGQIAISTGQLRDLGAQIDHALCVIDRQEGGVEALAAEFGTADHDPVALRDTLGPIGVAGFFAAGEVEPVAGHNHVHGFTASVLVFSGSSPGGLKRP